MQGVQVAPALNDENSTFQGVSQLKPSAPLQPTKQGSVLKSARKAFGNITNSGAPQPSASKTKQTAPLRRAFGDITNSAAKPPAGAATSKKAAGTSSLFAALPTAKKAAAPVGLAPDPAPAQSSSQVNTSAPAVAEASTKAVSWEDLEPERPAGKMWEQLEAEREAAMEADAIRSADAIWNPFAPANMFSFLVPPVDDSDDDLAFTPAPASTCAAFPAADLEPVPDLPVEDFLPSSADYASWLPDISPPTDDEDDSEVIDASAESAEPAEEAAAVGASDSDVAGLEAAVAGLAISGDASGSSSPGIAASRDTDMCKSPIMQPW